MILNTDKKKVTVWLAKLPKYLGEKILSADREIRIGTLNINRKENDNQVTIEISDTLKGTGIPTEYTISIKDQDKPMYILQNDANRSKGSNAVDSPSINSRRSVPDLSKVKNKSFSELLKDSPFPEEGSFSIQGVINKECFIRPVINEKYLEYKKAMQSLAEQNESTVKMIDYFAEVRKGEKYGSLKEMDILARKRKKQLQDKKRERLDKQDVIDIIFNAFEKHEFWTVRDLADFSGQPVAYIQELVSEICVLNKKDHRNTYELKPEYKQK